MRDAELKPTIDEGTVRHVAHLARLELTGEEISRFAGQLGAILDYVAQLRRVDVQGVSPMAHPLSAHNVFREDEVAESWSPERALHNAPSKQNDFFRVPKVLDQEGA